MAVTGACLMAKPHSTVHLAVWTRKSSPLPHNDVDYCLKLWQKGLLNVYTPRAEAYHYESKAGAWTPWRRERPPIRA